MEECLWGSPPSLGVVIEFDNNNYPHSSSLYQYKQNFRNYIILIHLNVTTHEAASSLSDTHTHTHTHTHTYTHSPPLLPEVCVVILRHSCEQHCNKNKNNPVCVCVCVCVCVHVAYFLQVTHLLKSSLAFSNDFLASCTFFNSLMTHIPKK